MAGSLTKICMPCRAVSEEKYAVHGAKYWDTCVLSRMSPRRLREVTCLYLDVLESLPMGLWGRSMGGMASDLGRAREARGEWEKS